MQFLLLNLALGMHVKGWLPHNGQRDDRYNSTDAHIMAILGFRKLVSTRWSVLKWEFGFESSKLSLVSLSLVL